MDTTSMMNDINRRVTRLITGGMTTAELIALRKKITKEVLEERAQHAGVDIEQIEMRWNLAIKMNRSVETTDHQFGL